MKAALLGLILLAAGGQPLDQDSLVVRGERLFTAQGCYGCHVVGTYGTPIGPNLSRVGDRYPEDYLRRWLIDPQLQRPAAHMPKLDLDRGQVHALAAWLSTLK